VEGYKKKLKDRVEEGKLVKYNSDFIYRILLLNRKIIRGFNVYINKRIPFKYIPCNKRNFDDNLRERIIDMQELTTKLLLPFNNFPFS
jgi:hypothetical protein